ncbi:hypothetical protein F4782DRAFT_524959 [Xylaria castorea]|nr:hypothetical protein F4782DRAFT_524959 [Xylaria castorea]
MHYFKLWTLALVLLTSPALGTPLPAGAGPESKYSGPEIPHAAKIKAEPAGFIRRIAIDKPKAVNIEEDPSLYKRV